MKKPQIRIFVLTLAFVLLFSGAALADCYEFPGSGTPEDPFLISTPEDLKAMSDTDRLGRGTADLVFCAQASYRLTADIDMAGYDWKPIGDSSVRIFRGYFNGGGHTIYNLRNTTINSTAKGLFGWLAGSVHDLNLSNVNFQGYPIGTEGAIGGVVGVLYAKYDSGTFISGGVIENVNVSGVITVGNTGTTNGRNAGGIVGVVAAPNARISGCSFNGDIVGVTLYADFLGGIVGYVNNYGTNLTVENCFSSGTITRPGTGSAYIGKIAGGWDTSAIYANPPAFSFCYSAMTRDAAAYLGWQGYDGIEINLDALALAVENAENLLAEWPWGYVQDENWAAFDEALQRAKYLMLHGGAQSEIDDAAAALQKAVDDGLIICIIPPAPPDLQIRFTLLKSTRVGLSTTYDNTFLMEVTNEGYLTAKDVTASLYQTQPSVVVIDGELSFGDIPGGGETRSDTFIIRVNRTVAFDENQNLFTFDYTY